MNTILGLLAPLLLYLLIFLLQLVVLGRWVVGYATRAGTSDKLRYHLNGLQILILVVLGWMGLCYSGMMAWDWFYTYRWEGLIGAVSLGIVFSLVMVVGAPAVKDSFAADFFLGRQENPQLWGGRIDAKMWLYLVGAVMLQLNVLSFAAHHFLLYCAEADMGIYLAAGLFTFFLIDYLTFEEVHLYTYDLFAERVGFKLGWGCIAFYPYFYAIPLWSTASLICIHTPSYLLVGYALIFFTGWGLSRGANLQKYYFKKDPTRSLLGIKPETITDGHKVLLVNGFWGLSRHINYLGEILMATGIVLCVGHTLLPWPWLYPLYYVALLFPRQADDDRRCALKYGALWQQYIARVPYRIIPKLY
jgi:protein-S-isoprenylcysteine O-methyltransferase Ste14